MDGHRRVLGTHLFDDFRPRPTQDGRRTPVDVRPQDVTHCQSDRPVVRDQVHGAIPRRATSAPPYHGYAPHPGSPIHFQEQTNQDVGLRPQLSPVGPNDHDGCGNAQQSAARHSSHSLPQMREAPQHHQMMAGRSGRAPSFDRLNRASEGQRRQPRDYSYSARVRDVPLMHPPHDDVLQRPYASGGRQGLSAGVRDVPPVYPSPDDAFQRPYASYGRQEFVGDQSGWYFDPQYHGRPMPRQTRYDQPAPMGGVQQVQQVNKVKRPATYDGKSSWEDYLVQFQMISEINKWDNRTKALELATSLRGQAMGVLTDLDPEQRESYGSLVTALSARFEPSNTAEIFRAKLKGRVRGKTEPLTELAHHIRHLTRKAYPSVGVQVREHLALESFIEALNDGELEWFVFQTKPQTIDQAVETALEYEAFKQGRRRRVGERHYVRMQNDDAPGYGQAQIVKSGHSNWQGGASQQAGGYVQSSRLLHIRDAQCDNGMTDSQEYGDQYGLMTEESLQPIPEEPYLCASCEDGRVARMSNNPSFNNNQNFNQTTGRFNGSSQRSQGCFNCGDMGHYRRECPKGVICNNCGQAGHVRRDCVGCHSSSNTGNNDSSQKDTSDKTVSQGNGKQLGQRAMPQQ